MLIYPNSMTFPIMDDSGIPPPPQGMLVIKVVRATKLGSPGISKIDPFVEVRASCAICCRAPIVHTVLCSLTVLLGHGVPCLVPITCIIETAIQVFVHQETGICLAQHLPLCTERQQQYNSSCS